MTAETVCLLPDAVKLLQPTYVALTSLRRIIKMYLLTRCRQDGKFLPESDYVTFGSLLSQIRLSSIVCNVRAPYSGADRGLKLSVIFLRHFVP